MVKLFLKRKWVWIATLLVGATAIAMFIYFQPVKREKSKLAHMIPGITTAGEVKKLLGPGESTAGTAEKWVVYSADRYPERGIRSVYMHYDKEHDKLDALCIHLESAILPAGAVKTVYGLDLLSAQNQVNNNQLTSLYSLKTDLLLAITYDGPTENAPVLSLTYLTPDGYAKGLLTKLPAMRP